MFTEQATWAAFVVNSFKKNQQKEHCTKQTYNGTQPPRDRELFSL